MSARFIFLFKVVDTSIIFLLYIVIVKKIENSSLILQKIIVFMIMYEKLCRIYNISYL